MSEQVPCPSGGVCDSSCKGFPVAKGLAEWRKAHPVADEPAGLTRSERRAAEAKRKKQKGTETYMTDTARGMIGKRCRNRASS